MSALGHRGHVRVMGILHVTTGEGGMLASTMSVTVHLLRSPL